MPKVGQHVVPNREGGWSVRKSGASKATKVFRTRDDAIAYARSLAQRQSSELYVHRKDGTIRDRDSYGADPFAPKNRD